MLATAKSHGIREWITDIILIALGLGLFYAAWINSYPLFTPDEGRYSEVAREMVANHDYVTPRLDGVAFLDKPVLYYWLQAIAINLFGVKEWALRLWPSAIGVLGCVMSYATGHALFNRRTGILAAIILATSPIYYGAAHYANLDLEVAVLISNSLLFFLMGANQQAGSRRTWLLLAAYVFAALAFLTKGLIGLAFPIMIIGAWILLLNHWRLVTNMHLLAGLALFLVIVTPWYYFVQQANPEFLHFFFVTQQVTRFLTKATFNSQAASWFYVPVVLACFMPWTVFLCQALVYHIKHIWQQRQTYKNELFLILWVAIIFIFFSIPKSKTIGYIIPIFPALALLTARYIDHIWEQTAKRSIRIAMTLFIVLAMLLMAACLIFPLQQHIDIAPGSSFYLYIAAAIFFVAAMATLCIMRRANIAVFFMLLLVTASLSLMTLIASTHVINTNTIKPLALHLKQKIQPTDEIVAYHKYYQDLPIYLEQRITIVADWHANDIQYNDNWLRELWYGMPFQDTSAWLIEDAEFWKRWNSDHRLFVFMKNSYYKDFTKIAKNNFIIDKHDDVLLISNQPFTL